MKEESDQAAYDRRTDDAAVLYPMTWHKLNRAQQVDLSLCAFGPFGRLLVKGQAAWEASPDGDRVDASHRAMLKTLRKIRALHWVKAATPYGVWLVLELHEGVKVRL